MGPAWRLQHPQSRALLWHVVSALHALLIPVCRCSMTQTACTAEPCSCLACDECPSASQSTCMPMHHCKGSLYNRACCLCSMLVLLSACTYALHLIKVPWCAGSKAVMSVIALHDCIIFKSVCTHLPSCLCIAPLSCTSLTWNASCRSFAASCCSLYAPKATKAARVHLRFP